MALISPHRRVITFYSFKGGVGRTMTLANVAYRLANKHGLKVIAVDWDLEAPGLHRFFGLSSDDAAKARGVLDYFMEWREAVERRDSEPPSVSDWILPISGEKHAPKFGALSLLSAGKLNDGYDRRLAALNWQDFYANGAGAAAVETLREQLLSKADVVLIDSRTGFTDAGGICTIQIPDGVVLMTAPNQQSLEGTGRVARAIAKEPKETRSLRDRPRIWFVACRVPAVEETYLTEQWFAANEPWFEAGVTEGLWLKEDHPEGIQSYKIPHRGRWSFDEAVLSESLGVDPNDPLSGPYDQLAESLLRWTRGEAPIGPDAFKRGSDRSIALNDFQAQEEAVAEAERRGDMLDMARNLRGQALGLIAANRAAEAVRKADQASIIFLSRGAREDYAFSLDTLGWALASIARYEEASETLLKGLDIARQIDQPIAEVSLLSDLAAVRFGQDDQEEAQNLLAQAVRITNRIRAANDRASALWVIGYAFAGIGDPQRATEILRDSAHLAHSHGYVSGEVDAIEYLLRFSDAGQNLPDADALRARLAELKAPDPQSPPS